MRWNEEEKPGAARRVVQSHEQKAANHESAKIWNALEEQRKAIESLTTTHTAMPQQHYKQNQYNQSQLGRNEQEKRVCYNCSSPQQ